MAKAYASTVIDAPADEVWARIRDFNGLPEWTGGLVSSSEIEEGKTGEQVGCVRHLTLGDGTSIRERLLEHSDDTRSYTYNFETTPFDVENYHATMRVTPVTDGDRSFIEWWTTFDCDRDRIAEWQGVFANDVFGGGFKALKAQFGG